MTAAAPIAAAPAPHAPSACDCRRGDHAALYQKRDCHGFVYIGCGVCMAQVSVAEANAADFRLLPSGGCPFCDPTLEPDHAYRRLALEVAKLVETKQAAYGDAFGRSGAVLRVLYPEGISLDRLDDALTVILVVDKLFRVATSRDALGESPWRDIAGYSLLALERQGRLAEGAGGR